MTTKEAMAHGWRPDPIGAEQTFMCQCGCGRHLVVAQSDKTCGYVCVECRAQSSAYLAHWKKKRRKASANDDAVR